MKRMLKWLVGAVVVVFVVIPGVVAVVVGPERIHEQADAIRASDAAGAVPGTAATAPKEELNAPKPKASESREKAGGISMENYLRLQAGMTVADVEAILGGPGEEMSRVELDGLPTTVSYKWQRWTGANIILMFQGG